MDGGYRKGDWLEPVMECRLARTIGCIRFRQELLIVGTQRYSIVSSWRHWDAIESEIRPCPVFMHLSMKGLRLMTSYTGYACSSAFTVCMPSGWQVLIPSHVEYQRSVRRYRESPTVPRIANGTADRRRYRGSPTVPRIADGTAGEKRGPSWNFSVIKTAVLQKSAD